MESHVRSIAKTLTWRFAATLITMAIAWFYTGDVGEALKIGGCDTMIKLFAYYGHERIWDRIAIGRAKPPEYSI